MRLIVTALILAISACAIAPTEKSMSDYVYMVESSPAGGTVTHMVVDHFRFETQPAEYAKKLMSERCLGKYEVIKEKQEQRAHNVPGLGAANNIWKIIDFKCLK